MSPRKLLEKKDFKVLIDEIWKPINGFEDWEISNTGDIRRLTAGRCTYPGRYIGKHISNRGYYLVSLSKDGALCTKTVHRLVTLNFLGPPPSPDHTVNHIDGNKLNNCVDNLEWATLSYQQLHAIKIGLKRSPKGIPKPQIAGMKHACHKLTDEEVIAIRNLIGVIPQIEIAKKFSVSKQLITKIKQNKIWQYLDNKHLVQLSNG